MDDSWRCFVPGCGNHATWVAFDEQFCDVHSPADMRRETLVAPA